MIKGIRTLIVYIFFACLLPSAYCQVRVIKATGQKVIAGTGGVFMNYEVRLKNKGQDSLVIDSVKTIVGEDDISFYFNKSNKAYVELAFGYSLLEPVKCRTCPDSFVRQSNFSQGVLIHYTLGSKPATQKVKKFKKLVDKLMP